MVFLTVIFWIAVFIIFYNYIGYAVIVYLLNKIKKSYPVSVSKYQPSVSFIVAAYNEEDVIEEKVRNCLALNYPRQLVEFIFITDGSTDNTQGIVARYPQVQLLHEPQRKGKSAALNRAVAHSVNSVLIFNDANTVLNYDALANITRHYASPLVGGVAGEKKVHRKNDGIGNTADNEGLYWKYESFLKQLDSDFYSVVGAAGELFSIRRELYEPVAENVILDDFIISMKVVQKGYRVVYEKKACASELPSASISDEKKRKIRIAAGGFQAIFLLKGLLYFWKHPRLTFLYISHRLLRWMFSPFCFFFAFASNFMLVAFSAGAIWDMFFGLQLVFYLLAILGYIGERTQKKLKLPGIAYYFVFMNYSVILGFFRFLSGRQSAAWDKARRSV